MIRRVRKIFLLLLLPAVGAAQNDLPRGTVLFGGDVFIGRFNNLIVEQNSPGFPFDGIKEWLNDADFKLVNLEGVISRTGMPSDKNERNPYFFRGRPEMAEILTSAGITCVNAANNHSGDYGPAALIEQMQILTKSGIGFVGIGKNKSDAAEFKVFKAGNVKIAVIGADATQNTSKAGEVAGTNYFDERSPNDFITAMKTAVTKARKYAHLVFLTVHWGYNGKSFPTKSRRKLAERLIRESRFDGIFGHSAHLFQGIEIIDNKPVIYDAGNLLLDYGGNSWEHKSFLYKMNVSVAGVERIELLPVKLNRGYTIKAPPNLRREMFDRMNKFCRKLGTNLVIDSIASINLAPNQRSLSELEEYPSTDKVILNNAIRPSAVIENLPKNIESAEITLPSGIKFHGSILHRKTTGKGRGFFVSTYWSCGKEIPDSYLIKVRVEPLDGTSSPWTDRDSYRSHQPGDWSMPTYRWKPGEIIEDYYFIRAKKNAAEGKYKIVYELVQLEKDRSSGTTSMSENVKIEIGEFGIQ